MYEKKLKDCDLKLVFTGGNAHQYLIHLCYLLITMKIYFEKQK